MKTLQLLRQRMATISTKEEKATTRMGCVSQDSDALVSQRGKQHRETRCKKSWDQFEKYGSLSLRQVKQVSGKRKDRRLQKYKSNLKISKVPTL